MHQLLHNFTESLLSLNKIAARNILAEALEANNSPIEALDNIVVPALEQIGTGWESGSVALSQVYMSGRICEGIIGSLLPMDKLDKKSDIKMGIAVLEDHHALGKRIVYSLLQSGGFPLQDYGHGLEVNDLVAKVKRDEIEIILISTLMLPSALKIKEFTDKLKSRSLNTKVIVGGAPFLFDKELWRYVSADAMGRSAADALNIIKRMVNEKSWKS